MIPGKRLLLASGSPRRRELLALLDNDIEIIKSIDVDESYPSTMDPYKVAEYISLKKSAAYDSTTLNDNDILITADTVVILNNRILVKPANADEAIKMLQFLRNRTHIVTTGITLRTTTATESFSSHTKVTFDNISDEEIKYYVNKYNPLDKAGSYGIQEWIGYIGISRIEGCYYNVMGLPMHDLYQAITKMVKH